MDQIVEQEKQNKLLKKLTIVFAIISLLTIAAVVGLTAAVVVLSKDTETSNDVLIAKDTGNALATAQYLSGNTLSEVAPTPAELSQMKTLIIPGADNVKYSVIYINRIDVNTDDSLTYYLADGSEVIYRPGIGIESNTTSSSGRRLLSFLPECSKQQCSGDFYAQNCVCSTGTGKTSGGGVSGGGGSGGGDSKSPSSPSPPTIQDPTSPPPEPSPPPPSPTITEKLPPINILPVSSPSPSPPEVSVNPLPPCPSGYSESASDSTQCCNDNDAADCCLKGVCEGS